MRIASFVKLRTEGLSSFSETNNDAVPKTDRYTWSPTQLSWLGLIAIEYIDSYT